MTDRSGPSLATFEAKSGLAHVFDELKQAIMTGELEPGQKVRIDEYARIFGVSHMPVREALNQLAVMGALVSEPRRSTRVPEFSQRRLHELMATRRVLEGFACREACLDEHDTAALESLIAQMDRTLSAKSVNAKRFLRLNQEFHFTIYEMSGNRELMALIEVAWLRYGPMLSLLRTSVGLREGQEHHRLMLEGLKTRDADKLVAGLEADLSRAADAIGALAQRAA